jgi:hypothetical protein
MPKKKDIFDELDEMQQKTQLDEMEQFFRDLEEMYTASGIKASPTPPTPPTPPTNPQYQPIELSLPPLPKSPYIYPPVNSVANWIWNQCDMGLRIRQNKATSHLFDWACFNKFYYTVKNKPHISFQYNNTHYMFQWPAFEKWFLCCCAKVDGPTMS